MGFMGRHVFYLCIYKTDECMRNMISLLSLNKSSVFSSLSAMYRGKHNYPVTQNNGTKCQETFPCNISISYPPLHKTNN